MKNTKLFVLAILLIALVAGTIYFWDILTMFLVSALIAYLLSPITNYIVRKTELKRGVAVAVVLFFFVSMFIFVFSVSTPSMVAQLGDLFGEIQKYASNLDELSEKATEYMLKLRLPEPVIDYIMSFISESDTIILDFIRSIISSIVGISLQLFDIVISVILIIYFMLDGSKLISKFISYLPEKGQIKITSMLSEADSLTWKYLKSRCIVSGGMAVATFIGFKLFGIRYALLFAIMSFFLDFIPYFGSFFAGVIEVFYALLTGGVPLAVGVLIFVLIVQQIEGNIVAPKVQGDAAGIHPITVMFALMACNRIWGTLGMLISTPVAAIVKLVVKELYSFVIQGENEDGENQIILEE